MIFFVKICFLLNFLVVFYERFFSIFGLKNICDLMESHFTWLKNENFDIHIILVEIRIKP